MGPDISNFFVMLCQSFDFSCKAKEDLGKIAEIKDIRLIVSESLKFTNPHPSMSYMYVFS